MSDNASACWLKILIGDDSQDWSKTLKSFDVGLPKRDRGGLFQTTGILTLTYWDYAFESMNPRLNPSRWHRGQIIKVLYSFDGTTYSPHPCGWLYILKEPLPPHPDAQDLVLQVGCKLALEDYAEPNNDKSGVILGTATNRTTAIGNILAAANITTLTGTIDAYPIAHPLPKIGGSYVQQAGKVAYAGFRALWQDNSGNIEAIDLTIDPHATPDLSVTIGLGGGEITYQPSEGAETPVEELRCVGLDKIGIDTWRCLDSLPQENYQTSNSGSGAVTRLLRRTTVIDCQGLDSSGKFYKQRQEIVEEQAGSVYPNDEPGSSRLTFSSDTTTTYYYEPGVTGRLLTIDKQVNRPLAAAIASFWSNLSADQKRTYSRISPTESLREVTTFTYTDYPTPQDGSVADQYAFNYQSQVVTGQVTYSQAPVATLIADPTELAALGNPSPTGLVPSGRTTEAWAKVRSYEWQKTTITEQPFITANPDGAALSTTLSSKIALVTTDQKTDVSAAGTQQPAAPERRPDRYTEVEIQIKGRALFGTIAGTNEQKRFRCIEVEYMVSGDQATAIAQMEGTLLIGRRQGQRILLPLTPAFISAFRPLMLIACTEPDGTIYLYQADAIQFTHDPDKAVVGCEGIWFGTIAVGTTAVKLPYSPIVPLDGGLVMGGTLTAYPYSLTPVTVALTGGLLMGGHLNPVIVINLSGGLRLGGTLIGGPRADLSGGLRLGGDLAFAGSAQVLAGGLRLGGSVSLVNITVPLTGGLRLGGSFVSGNVASLTLTNVSLRYVAKSSYVTLSGSNVTALQDISGNANHLSSSSSPPSWNATGLSGNPTIVHVPNQWLEFANSASTQISGDMTWYCVAAYNNYADGNFNTILEKGPHSSGLNYLFGKAAFYGGTQYQNNQKFTYNDGSFRDILESTVWTGTNNQFYVFTVVVDKTNGLVSFYVNGTLNSSVSNALTYPSTDTTGGRVGANGVSTEGFNGSWSEQVLDRAAHNSTTVASNVAALRAYWGI